MKLIGMLDSPYVRRTAIAMRAMNIDFEHVAWSVFVDFDKIAEINPVVKVPTLALDDGTVLVDSSLILDYLQSLAAPKCRLMPVGLEEKAQALKVLGITLAGCDKAVQLFYERNLKPADKQHQPWMERVATQMRGAFQVLEQDVAARPLPPGATLPSITAAVIWQFVNAMLPDIVAAQSFPALDALSEASENLPLFKAFPPDGPGASM